jgi:hypothetical protein
MPVIAALAKLRPWDPRLKASLGYTVRPYLNTNDPSLIENNNNCIVVYNNNNNYY